jgi:hypothetical protein
MSFGSKDIDYQRVSTLLDPSVYIYIYIYIHFMKKIKQYRLFSLAKN